MTQFNPWPKNIVLRSLAYAWSSLTMLFVLPFVGIFVATEQIVSRGWKDGAWEFVTIKGSWFYKNLVTKKYDGFSFGWCILYVEECDFNNLTVRVHERIHLQQQIRLSIVQWILYGLFSLAILVCTKLRPIKANSFEIDARLQAGQEIGDLLRK